MAKRPAGERVAGERVAGERVAGQPTAGRPTAGRPTAGQQTATVTPRGGLVLVYSALMLAILLAMLAGTLPATAGQVVYDGRDITGLPAFRRARLGLVRTFQLASEFKQLTVMENLLSAVPRNRGDSFRGALLGRRYWRGG
jgi:hypothetical protein